MQTGSCECGSVRYQVTGELRPVVACHCSQCRKTSGHYWAATQVPNDRFELTQRGALKWFNSSDTARRGFCADCGSSLFWELAGEGATSIGAGTLDTATGVELAAHIFCADKGDYYAITDDVPQRDRT